MVFRQPHWEDVEPLIAREHRVEGGEIAERLLHHLGPRIHKDTMHIGSNIAELLWTVS